MEKRHDVRHEVQNERPTNPHAEMPIGSDDTPKFGRLLIALFLAVMLIVAITFGSEAFFTP